MSFPWHSAKTFVIIPSPSAATKAFLHTLTLPIKQSPVNPSLGVREHVLGSQPRTVLKELLSAKSSAPATGVTWAIPEFRKSAPLCHQVILRTIPLQRTFVQLHHESGPILSPLNMENFCRIQSSNLAWDEATSCLKIVPFICLWMYKKYFLVFYLRDP